VLEFNVIGSVEKILLNSPIHMLEQDKNINIRPFTALISYGYCPR
jgi:hypothetical protein